MKNQNIFITLFLFLFALTAFAQEPLDPGWLWAKRGGSTYGYLYEPPGNEGEHIIDIAVDGQNNYYFLAEVGGYHYTIDTMEFDTYNDHPQRRDIVVFSTDDQGNFRWEKTIGGGVTDFGISIGVDDLGNVYIGGRTTNFPGHVEVHFDSDSTMAEAEPILVPNPNNKKIFIIKYDTDGNFQWLRQPESDQTIIAYSGAMLEMIVEPNGTTHSMMVLTEGTYFDGQLVVPPMDTIAANIPTLGTIIKYNSAGDFLGFITVDMRPTPSQFFAQMAYDPELDRYYIANTYGQSTDIENEPLSINEYGTETGEKGVYLAAVDNQGEVIWYHEDQRFSSYALGDVALDDAGNVYLTGAAKAPNNFAGYVFDQLGTGSGNENPYLIKLDNDGNLLWGTNSELYSPFPGQSIAISGNDVYLGLGMLHNTWNGIEIDAAPNGSGLTPDIQIVRFNAQTGIAQEVIQNSEVHTATKDEITALAIDHTGDLVVGGHFGTDLFYNTDLHVHNNAQSSSDFFIARYCPAPLASFTYDTIAGQTGGYNFAFSGTTAFIDSVVWAFDGGASASGLNPQYTFSENGTYTVCAIVYNKCRSDTTCATIEVDGLVSVASVAEIENIKLYPNPTTGKLTIQSDIDLKSYTLSDLQGRIVGRGNLLSNTIDLSAFNPGVYLLRVRSVEGSRRYFRVVVGR